MFRAAYDAREGRWVMQVDRENAHYEANVANWLGQHAGEYVVIKDEGVLGFYGTEDDALAAGASTYGTEPFLVRKVGEPPQKMDAPALALGILRVAHS